MSGGTGSTELGVKAVRAKGLALFDLAPSHLVMLIEHQRSFHSVDTRHRVLGIVNSRIHSLRYLGSLGASIGSVFALCSVK